MKIFVEYLYGLMVWSVSLIIMFSFGKYVKTDLFTHYYDPFTMISFVYIIYTMEFFWPTRGTFDK